MVRGASWFELFASGRYRSGGEWLIKHIPREAKEFSGTRLNMKNNGGIYSFHNGIHVCFGDGAVRFLGEPTEPDVILKLLTRDAGDISSF